MPPAIIIRFPDNNHIIISQYNLQLSSRAFNIYQLFLKIKIFLTITLYSPAFTANKEEYRWSSNSQFHKPQFLSNAILWLKQAKQ